MLWVAIALLALAGVAPLLWALERGVPSRGARELAVALHRTQLAELDRDLAEGRILPGEHATAVLEVQRRLLAAAGKDEAAPRLGARGPIVLALVLVPLLAFGLYLQTGQPGMPSLSREAREALVKRQRDEDALVDQLRTRVAALDPMSEQARQGYVLLGNIEEERGRDAAAAQAWTVALRQRFDPTLAVRTAAASERVDGALGPQAIALLRRALAAAPPDAPWRASVEARLAQEGP